MIDVLGPERVMFGTDTPDNVDVEFAKYETLQLSEDTAEAVFAGTAMKFFRLE